VHVLLFFDTKVAVDFTLARLQGNLIAHGVNAMGSVRGAKLLSKFRSATNSQVDVLGR
jgi:hypothetical protein